MEESIREAFKLPAADLRTYSPVTLAFVGDAVYDLMIRTLVALRANRPANALNEEKITYVNAAAQARLFDRVCGLLSEEEADICRRGRNAKTATKAKNQSTADYHKATGLEALIGFLYLSGREDRILELLRYGLEHGDE